MTCVHCARFISDEAMFCEFWGTDQRASPGIRSLRRSRANRKIAGVCGGIANYLGIDPMLVRLVWAVLTIVPGSILLGVLAYLVAWLLTKEAAPDSEPKVGLDRTKRLFRSLTDAKIAGVCGGIAQYFAVDATALRLLWIALSIFPGLVVCGIMAYGAAWFLMPRESTPIEQHQQS